MLWGHHKLIIDKLMGQPEKALFYVRQTIKYNVLARYALEGYNQPLGILEYELAKLYPADFKSSLPSIEEIERGLKDK